MCNLLTVSDTMISQEEVKSLALEVGFDDVGISIATRAEGVEDNYREWISRGYHGEMQYLARNLEKRLDPSVLVPGAKSVISALLSYNFELTEAQRTPPRIARYAWLRDYHLIVKERLFRLLERLRERYGEVNGRAFVDSAPFLDRYWAQKSGLGWIGKHSLLIHPKYGSFCFIGSLVINLSIEPSEREIKPHCGRCRACIDACPTGALLGPGLMNATRCIAYLTIEKRGALSAAEEQQVGNWAFGCDACQEACPWNRRAGRADLRDEQLLTLELIRELREGRGEIPQESPLTRGDKERLVRLLQKTR